MHDSDLIREYAASGSESAFVGLVNRHIALVYSAALRQMRDAHLAEDVTQAVFIVLAHKAGSLSRHTSLSGWLLQAARYAASAQIRAAIRRSRREHEATMHSTVTESREADVWQQLMPLLDEGLLALRDADRDVLVMRYFENKTAREIGGLLRISEEAAQRRAKRALEKLRKFFHKRGVRSTAALIAGAVSANSIQAVPPYLVKNATAVGVGRSIAADGSTALVIRVTLRKLAWARAKLALTVGAGLFLAAGAALIAYQKGWTGKPAWQVEAIVSNSTTLEQMPPLVQIAPTRFSGGAGMRGVVRAGKIAGLNQPLEDIIRVAWGDIPAAHEPAGLVSEVDLPAGNFDYIASLRHDSAAALQQEIRRRFGIVARPEMRAADVLLLRLNDPNAAGFKLATPDNTPQSRGVAGGRSWINANINELTYFLEALLKVPIIDQTGLTQRYNFDLHWTPTAAPPKIDNLQPALMNQLGLKLIPERRPVALLVISKATN